jgi:hypothetical protein
MAYDYWLPGFNFNVEEWFEGDHYETLAICRSLELARVALAAAIAEKPAGRFMIRSRTGWCSGIRRATGERYATLNKLTRAFRFLRHASRPSAPRPVAKSGRAAGTGVFISSNTKLASICWPAAERC